MERRSRAVPAQQASKGRCEVAVQWEEPEDRFHDVGVQSDTRWCDVAVQVDLIGLGCRTQGASDVPWRCSSLRPEQAAGGALWHCCVHAVLPPPPAASATLLGPSPSRTPDPELQTALPGTHASSPSRPPPTPVLQSGLSLPSMPSCGDSPSSEHQGAPSAALGPEDAEVQAPVGLMAPLSSDEEEAHLPGRDKQSSAADAPVKKRPGRPKNKPKPSPSDPESAATQKQRRKTERAARLPLRFLLDYDLESHDPLSANKTPRENGEGAGAKRDDGAKSDAKVLLLPYYKPSLKLEEFQNMARETYEALQQDERRWPNSASIAVHPALEQLMPRPLSPGEVVELSVVKKPPVPPLKLKKVKKPRPPASIPIPGWSVKAEPTGGENGDLERSDRADAETEKEAPELFKKTVIKKEDDGILAKRADSESNGLSPTGSKRKAGRPAKRACANAEIKCDEVKAESHEMQLDRPRRVTVGPPVRYLLESEGRSGERREDEAQSPRRAKLKLGDLAGGGTVKKVKILNGETESAERRAWMNRLESVAPIKYEDIEDIYVLPEDATGCRDWERGAKMEEEREDEERRKRRRGGSAMDLSRRVSTAFLVFKDDDTSAVTLIPPCSVKLQKLSDGDAQMIGQSGQDDD